MSEPQQLSVAEIRKYMLANGCKVTNHALVKHFKRFLTHPDTQKDARKQFKTYVNILATIKNENNQKYLILRKKYLHECPSEEVAQQALQNADATSGNLDGVSFSSESSFASSVASPIRQPPPYKPPPTVSSSISSANVASTSAAAAINKTTPLATGVVVAEEHVDKYRECVNEFAAEAAARRPASSSKANEHAAAAAVQEPQSSSISRNNSRNNSLEDNKENIQRFSFSSGASGTSTASSSTDDKTSSAENKDNEVAAIKILENLENDNRMTVKEATRKFNRMASQEDAKIISPPAKKKPEKDVPDVKTDPEVTINHPKAKEWIVAMAKANYQVLAKLANDHPELVKLQDPFTGYTALHWAAKHGNDDVIKLIAGTYKADVNSKTYGGYTPLHLAMQFGRSDTYELLWNVYKANRDAFDSSGNKPKDYNKNHTTVSPSTYSKIKAKRKHTIEKDLGFLRIGSLNVRVKKTTEAFSNFLGVGSGNVSNYANQAQHGNTRTIVTANPHHQRSRHRHHHRLPAHHHHAGTMRNHRPTAMMTKTITPLAMKNQQLGNRASMPINQQQLYYDKLHKSWGSADNIPHNGSAVNELMPPPTLSMTKRDKLAKRISNASVISDNQHEALLSDSNTNLNSGGYSSMPTTPNQMRANLSGTACQVADSDSDSACGFGSNWSVSRHSSMSSGNLQNAKFP